MSQLGLQIWGSSECRGWPLRHVGGSSGSKTATRHQSGRFYGAVLHSFLHTGGRSPYEMNAEITSVTAPTLRFARCTLTPIWTLSWPYDAYAMLVMYAVASEAERSPNFVHVWMPLRPLI